MSAPFHQALTQFIDNASPTLRSDDFDENGFSIMLDNFALILDLSQIKCVHGTTVLVYGIKSNPRLNGRAGLLGKQLGSGRWATQLITPAGLRHMLLRGATKGVPQLFETKISLHRSNLAFLDLDQLRWSFASPHNGHVDA